MSPQSLRYCDIAFGSIHLSVKAGFVLICRASSTIAAKYADQSLSHAKYGRRQTIITFPVLLPSSRLHPTMD